MYRERQFRDVDDDDVGGDRVYGEGGGDGGGGDDGDAEDSQQILDPRSRVAVCAIVWASRNSKVQRGNDRRPIH